MQQFSRFILKLSGWKYIRTTPYIDKSVICLAPHTSNWDFIISKLFYTATGGKNSHFFMKREWFFFPLGLLLRGMGGIPVDRRRKTSLTDQVVAEFGRHKKFHLGVTPEGTRRAVKEWKKGFYFIAVKAGVPIQLAYIDYAKKEAGITGVFIPTGNEKADFAEIKSFYKNVTGRFPERFIR
ncbi:MAG: 1-acyl-sn-glycerol-3-phosphate acyltransferase [Paludibacteraceae bacterium]|nr:1-acyl-sn-glycerol-3-phosphate acyltransferase [Paludibacteraceae bacterium]